MMKTVIISAEALVKKPQTKQAAKPAGKEVKSMPKKGGMKTALWA